MIKKPISHADYERIMKLSYNDFSRWFRTVMEDSKAIAIQVATVEIKKQLVGDPDADIYSWDADTLRERLREAGFAPRSVDTIMDILLG